MEKSIRLLVILSDPELMTRMPSLAQLATTGFALRLLQQSPLNDNEMKEEITRIAPQWTSAANNLLQK